MRTMNCENQSASAVDLGTTLRVVPRAHSPSNNRPERNENCVTYVVGLKCYLCRRLLRTQFPVSNEQLAPPPAFCLISAGSSVQLSFERLSNADPAAPSAGTPAMASVAKISLARRPVMVCLAQLKVSSQERAEMSILPTGQTILSAVTDIFLA